MSYIEFRVWDKSGEHKMLPVSQLSWDEHDDGILRLHFCGCIGEKMLGSFGVHSGFGNVDGSEDTGWVLMQYTGLKDKHGVKLFANDIIQTPDGTMYIIQYERLVAAWQAWDFKAWAKGYYDAYIPLKDVGCIVMEDCDPPCTPEPKFDDVVKLGTTLENPELCPEIFDDNEVKS